MTTTTCKGPQKRVLALNVLMIIFVSLAMLMVCSQLRIVLDQELLSVPVARSTTEHMHHPVRRQASHTRTKTDFIPTKNLTTFQDVFSASWWQSVERFQQFDVEDINTVEDDAFVPILKAGNGKEDVRMPMDWMDFCVEHLSKWWKILGNDGMLYAIGKLQSYTQRLMTMPPESNIMATTLAVIPYGVSTDDPIEQKIWETSLASTISSLIRQGIGRVVVVGYYETDTNLALAAFRHLQRHDENNKMALHGDNSVSGTVGSTELSYVRVTTKDVWSKFVNVNVPKGALKGLQQALKGTKKDSNHWVGPNPDKYKYIFMTEADQILQARLSPSDTQFLDDGRIIVPHRLQPIPHEIDVEGIVLWKRLFLSLEEHPVVHELSASDSCCDTTDMPWNENVPSGCGDFWWQCGFTTQHNGDHSRLKSYDLVRLSQGTGIVNLASTEHSRHCVPSKAGCRVRPTTQ